MSLGQVRENLRVVSLGVGTYPEPQYPFYKAWWWYQKIESVRLLQKTLNINTASMEQLRLILFKDVPAIRISDTFSKPEMATDLMEFDLEKLDLLYQQGRQSFAPHENKLREFLL